MSFLNSLPLWSGLAALGVGIPILIHLWSRRQKVEIPWAAMELLKIHLFPLRVISGDVETAVTCGVFAF